MTDVTNETVEQAAILLYKEGLKWGGKIGKQIANGEIDPTIPIKLFIPIESVDTSTFSMGTKALLMAGSEEGAIVLNGGLVAAGLYTGGNSAVQYAITTNPAAKKCYFLSVVFSMSAVGNGGFAVLSKTCHLSSHGVLSEALGAGLMWCGNACQVAALKAEGKPIPPKLQQSLKRKPRIFGQNGNGVAFTMPVASTISFQKLATIIGISITVYSYSKLVIKAYRYGQQFITNYKKEKHSSLSFRTRVEFIVISFHKCSSVRRVNGIYSFAISY